MPSECDHSYQPDDEHWQALREFESRIRYLKQVIQECEEDGRTEPFRIQMLQGQVDEAVNERDLYKRVHKVGASGKPLKQPIFPEPVVVSASPPRPTPPAAPLSAVLPNPSEPVPIEELRAMLYKETLRYKVFHAIGSGILAVRNFLAPVGKMIGRVGTVAGDAIRDCVPPYGVR